MRTRPAFTLLEVLAAMAVLAIALAALLHLHLHSIRATTETGQDTHALLLARQKLEETIAPGWPQLGRNEGDTERGHTNFHWLTNVTDYRHDENAAPMRQVTVTVTPGNLQLTACITDTRPGDEQTRTRP